MNYWNEQIQVLKKYLNFNTDKNSLRHHLENINYLIPFKTRTDDKIDYTDIFQSIWEFSRMVTESHFSGEIDHKSLKHEVLNYQNLYSDNSAVLDKFSHVIDSYLENEFSENTLNSPYFLKFKKITSKEKKVKDIAEYFYQVMYIHSHEIKKLFSTSTDKGILSTLVAESLNKKLSHYNAPKSDDLNFHTDDWKLVKLFNRDLNLLSKYPEYFLKNMGLLFNYYFMRNIFNTAINISLKNSGDFSEIHPLYFAIDSESINTKRKSYTQGYRYYKEFANSTYFHCNTLEHLFIFLNAKSPTYDSVKDKFLEISPEESGEFSYNLNNWIKEYCSINKGEIPELEDVYSEFSQVYTVYFKTIEKIHTTKDKKATYSRYTANNEELCKANFLKARGSLGYTFNVTEKFLFFLTSLCTGTKKILLKDLFLEFEERGIFLDRKSREEVIKILEKSNLLEKKSDGGEVQYVRPILHLSE